MGLQKKSSSATWVSLSKGVLSTKRDGMKEEFEALCGRLIGLEFSDKKLPETFGSKEIRQLTITVSDGRANYKLGVDSSSGYGRQLKAKLANILDFSHEIELVPTYVDETKAAGMFVNSGGSPVKQLWRKDLPLEGMPAATCTQFKGKDLWDYSEQEKFIEQYIVEHVVPRIAAVEGFEQDFAGEASSQELQEFDDKNEGEAGEEDDAPF